MAETRGSAAGAEKSARYAMVAALGALATVLVSIIPGCIERLRAQGMGYPPGGYGIRQDVPNVGGHIPDRIVSGSSIPVDKTWPELTPEEQKRWKAGVMSRYRLLDGISIESVHRAPDQVSRLGDRLGAPRRLARSDQALLVALAPHAEQLHHRL
jgi:hypothetical protein